MRLAARTIPLLLALAPAVGHALTPDEIVRQVWDRFETECGLALTDTQQYLRLVGTDYDSTSVNASPDGGHYGVSSTRMIAPNAFISGGYETFGTNGLGQTSCDVHFFDGGMALDDATGMNAAFRAEAIRRGVTSLSGGEVPSHDSSSDGMLGTGDEFQSFGYALTGPIGPGYLTTASVGGAEFFLNVTFTAPSNHPLQPPGTNAPAPSASTDPQPPAVSAKGAEAAPAPTPPTFDQAVRANLGLALRLCIRADGSIPVAVASFQQAGFSYQPMSEQNGDVWHRFFGPAETVRAEMLQGQMAPSCDVYTNHLPPRDVAPLVGSLLVQALPGRFRPAPAEGACAIFTDNATPLPTLVTVGAVDGTAGCAALGSTIVSVFKAV